MFPRKSGSVALFLRKHGGNMGVGAVFRASFLRKAGPWIPFFRRVGAVSPGTRVSGVLSPSRGGALP